MRARCLRGTVFVRITFLGCRLSVVGFRIRKFEVRAVPGKIRGLMPNSSEAR